MAENITVPAARALDAPVARPATGPGSGPARQAPPAADERPAPGRHPGPGPGEPPATGERREKAARRRVRSSTVALGSMGVLAAALAACGSEPDRRCVDRDSYTYTGGYKVVDSSQCRNGSSGTSGGTGGGGTSGGSRYGGDRGSNADWYYGGDSRSGYASDGSFHKSSVSSGGFGCSGKGSGGG
ncbi:hypothetical protein [Streptomyces sp. BBFR102]|uniref:hypothetical protein n=1 Tax=Streptomyces sp. BBFR102 TaxID=3448171 RepID=UPI003F5362DF